MRNKNGKIIFFIWLLLAGLFILTLLVLIEPLTEILTPALGSDGLNCAVPEDGKRGSCLVFKGTIWIFVIGLIYYIIQGLINKFQEP
jgi:hypothetical protein